jgi:hypothetical protein
VLAGIGLRRSPEAGSCKASLSSPFPWRAQPQESRRRTMHANLRSAYDRSDGSPETQRCLMIQPGQVCVAHGEKKVH